MKKKRLKGGDYLSHFKRLLLIMKLTVLLIFAGLITVSASSYSQATKLSLQMNQVNAHEVFKQIEAQSDFVFIYKSEAIDLNKKINVKMKESTVDVILDEVLKDLDLKYEIINKQIFVTKDHTLPVKNPGQLFSEVQHQPQKKRLSGKVTDAKGEGIPGTTVIVKGTTIGAITDVEGKFIISIPADAKTLSFSFIGYKSQEVAIGNQTMITVVLEEQTVGLEEVVAVGYGVQKKASVVGAIATVTGKDLQRSGGVNNLGQALTGRLSGVTTIQTSGQPGKEDPIIYIRGQGTWNGGQPYILVDGVERKMSDIDMSEVDNISVLKDASATAVYGVKGANGVILITTKRGSIGKPQLSVSANSTLRWSSRLVDKLDSYDTFMVKDAAIEREVPLLESMWSDYTPLAIAQRYRNQQSLKYPEAYPNVDWQKVMIKPYTMDHRVNMNVSGGTDFAKYFSSLAYSTESDLLKTMDNGRGYTPGFGYNKFNFRTNLDLNLTKTTSLKFNLAGVYSQLKTARGGSVDLALQGEYFTPPDAYLPQYADGRWGVSPNFDSSLYNPAAILANQGYEIDMATDLTSDLGINQKLDFITQGLSASANLSFDNHFESAKLLREPGGSYPQKYIYPAIEDMPVGGDPNSYITLAPYAGTNQFAWIYKPWTLEDENADNSAGLLSFNPMNNLRRRLYYQAQLSYARAFGKHDVTTTGVFTREQLATGSEFQRYREDWVARGTYNYDNRYFAEFNGRLQRFRKIWTCKTVCFLPFRSCRLDHLERAIYEKYFGLAR